MIYTPEKIINRYINEKFVQKNRTKIAPEFSYKIIKSKYVIFRIQIWEIPGQYENPELSFLSGCIRYNFYYRSSKNECFRKSKNIVRFFK